MEYKGRINFVNKVSQSETYLEFAFGGIHKVKREYQYIHNQPLYVDDGNFLSYKKETNSSESNNPSVSNSLSHRKDVPELQSSLENPLASYFCSRKSFAADSPHFGQGTRLETPPSLSKEPFKQQLLEVNNKQSAHLLSFGHEAKNQSIPHNFLIQNDSSKLTFQKQDDSSVRYDNLNFDSFQKIQRPTILTTLPKHFSNGIGTNFVSTNKRSLEPQPCPHFGQMLSEDESLIEEDSIKRDEFQNQQSTSEPKSSDMFISHNEENEDLEELIIAVSKSANQGKRMERTDQEGIFSGSSSHQLSLASQKSEERKVRKTLEKNNQPANVESRCGMSDIGKRDVDNERHKASMSSEFGKDLKNDMTCYFSKLLERTSANGLDKSRVSHEREGRSKVGAVEGQSLSIKKVILSSSKERNNRPASKKSRCSNSGSQKKRLTRERISLTRSREDMQLKTLPMIECSPKSSVNWKKLSNQPITLRLDLTYLSRSPRHVAKQEANSSTIPDLRLGSNTNRGRVKEGLLMSRISQNRSPNVFDRSSNLSSTAEGKQCFNIGNNSQAALTTRELKKFMDRRKLTKTNLADQSSHPNCRSVIRLKSKKKLEKTPPIGDGENRPESVKRNAKDFLHIYQNLQKSSNDLRESKNSYLSDLFREKSQSRVGAGSAINLRVSGDTKMGEQERAKLRLMADRHLEVSKCLTSRSKISFENTLNPESTAFKVRPDVGRLTELTPERLRLTYKNKALEKDTSLAQSPAEDRSNLAKEWANQEQSIKVENKGIQGRVPSLLQSKDWNAASNLSENRKNKIQIDIGTLSTKVMSAFHLEG